MSFPTTAAFPFVIAGLDPAIHAAEMRGGWFCILASKPRGTLYVGVTNDLVRRVHEHREGGEGFAKQYDVRLLVYFERHATMPLAIQREKNVKRWSRQWKMELIEGFNPQWRDLRDQHVRHHRTAASRERSERFDVPDRVIQFLH